MRCTKHLKANKKRTALALGALLACVLATAGIAYAGASIGSQEGSAAPAASERSTAVSSLQDQTAVASVGGTVYDTLPQALAACPAGGTVRLEKDCMGGAAAAPAAGVSLDLAGHSLHGLELGEGAALRVCSSAAGGRVVGSDVVDASALSVGAGGALQLEGVSVVAASAARSVKAVELGEGASLAASSCTFESASARGAAVCVGASGAAELAFSACSFKALSSSVDGSAFGISEEGAGSRLTADDCSFDIDGCAGMAGAVQAAGTVSLGKANINVQTASAASLAWGVRALQGAGAFELSGSTIALESAAGAGAGSYYCLLDGAPGSPAGAQWSLQGNTLSSVNGTPASFELSAASKTLVRNLATGGEYTGLAEALAAASAGETLTLTADARVQGALSITRPVVLDLAGHTLTVSAGKDAAAGAQGTGGALAFSNSGANAINSSSGSGRLVIECGAPMETAASAASGYQGIGLGGGAQLAIEHVSVSVAYTGASSAKPALNLAGIGLAGGSLSLQGGASLCVKAAARSGAYGASWACGIRVAGGSPQVSVASGCSVEVDANAATLSKGDLNSLRGNANASSPIAPLMQVFPQEGSALYEEAQQLFLENAQLDHVADKGGYVHGAGLYYAAAMRLSSGYYLWAFSEPVAREDMGKREAIRAAYFFTEVIAQQPSSGCGVFAAAGSSPRVELAGSVACTASGDATALQMEGEGSVAAAAQAQLKASASGSSYRKELGSFGLESVIEGLGASAGVTYPANTVWRRAAFAAPQAQAAALSAAVSAQLACTRTEAQPNTALPRPQTLEDACFDELGVTVAGLRTSDGSAKAPYTARVRLGSPLSAAVQAAGAPSSFASAAGTQYRLAGWSVKLANGKRKLVSTQQLAQMEVGCGLNVKDAETSIVACYAPVAAGCCLVGFESGELLDTCIAPRGASCSYACCSDGAASNTPVLYPATTGVTSTFKGWRTAQGTLLEASELPVADDCRFSAVFEDKGNNINLTLYAWCQGENAIVFQALSRTVQAGAELMPLLDAETQPGSELGDEEYSYRFLGWSTRASDREPLYTQECPPVFAAATLYGIYEQAERVVDVEFYGWEGLLCSARGLAPGTTVAHAYEATAQERPFDKTAGEPFRGWTAREGSFELLADELVTVGSVSGASTVKLYAVYGYERALLTFVDADGTTQLALLNAMIGKTVSDANLTVVLPPKKMKSFSHWQLADGTRFSLTSTIVSGPATVYAVYKGGSGAADSNGGTSSGPVETGSATAGKRPAASLGGGSGSGPAEREGSDDEGEASAEGDGEPGDADEPAAAPVGGTNGPSAPEAGQPGAPLGGGFSLPGWVSALLVAAAVALLAVLFAGSRIARVREERELAAQDGLAPGREIRF